MKNVTYKWTALAVCLFTSGFASAQSSSMFDNPNNWIILFIGVALLMVIITVAGNLLKVEAKSAGANLAKNNFSILPSFQEIFGSSAGRVADTPDGKVVKLTKGYDMNLDGEAANTFADRKAGTYCIQPTDFIGMSPIPKMLVAVGDKVKAGDALFFDKKRPEIKYCSPVSGEVVAINRGEKRKIIEVIVKADATNTYKSLDVPSLDSVSRADLVAFLLESGAWPMILQRPYNIVAETDVVPSNIFVSTFDSAPLAPSSAVVVAGREEAFQKGLDVLNQLTDGKVFLGINDKDTPAVFQNASGVEKNYFNGPHPAGNVGVQIHHVAPMKPSDKVWTMNVQGVITLGALFTEQRFNAERVVALVGAELKTPQYVRTNIGANLEAFLKDNVKSDNYRVVSGDVLTGTQTSKEGFLGFYEDQVTVLEEGNEHELFGWLLPQSLRPSISNTFPNFLVPNHKFIANTNTHGEERAFVVTGEYESVLPMDIYPQHIMKAIMMKDYERMEGLGLYELVEEDVALCEFACTSKQPLQEILREGLELMRADS